MSEFIWSALKLVAGFTVIGLAIIVVLFVAMVVFIFPAVFPRIKHDAQVRWSRFLAPFTKWRAKQKPSLEVSETAWEKIFLFKETKIKVGGNTTSPNVSAKFNYQFISYQSGMRKEVSRWCEDNLAAIPTIHPPYVTSPEHRVRMFLFFKNENDAFAFKMRWF